MVHLNYHAIVILISFIYFRVEDKVNLSVEIVQLDGAFDPLYNEFKHNGISKKTVEQQHSRNNHNQQQNNSNKISIKRKSYTPLDITITKSPKSKLTELINLTLINDCCFSINF